MTGGSRAHAARSAVLRGLALSGIWLSLPMVAIDSVAFGLVVVVVATAVSLRVLPPSHAGIDGRRLPGFLWRFVRDSVVGGVDVARRAVALRPTLAPDLIVVRLTLTSVGERVLLADLMSLLPGTLAADLEGLELTVHVIDRYQDVHGQVRSLEAQIGGLRVGGSK